VKVRRPTQGDSLAVVPGDGTLVAPDGRHRHLQLLRFVALPQSVPPHVEIESKT